MPFSAIKTKGLDEQGFQLIRDKTNNKIILRDLEYVLNRSNIGN